MNAPRIDPNRPVLVTGATGYVAGVVIRRLLEEGLTIHATVRDARKTERLDYLNELAMELPGHLEFFSADLLDEGSFADAMSGCRVVLHIASPFISASSDPRRELVEPALRGTRNVLEEANRTPSVERVVLTSSCAAIYGDNADLRDTPDGVFTEEIWNTSSSLEHGGYFYSKTLAEREAWAIHESQARWELVVLNPSMVLGPGVRIHPTSESFHMIRQFGDGTLALAVPDLGLGVVDVRDVAEAHLRAAFLPGAHGRNILSGHDTSLPEMARILRDRYGDYPLSTRTAPKWLLWLVGPWVNAVMTRRFVRRNVGLPWKADNRKSIRELGMHYRPLDETLDEFFRQLVDAGELTRP